MTLRDIILAPFAGAIAEEKSLRAARHPARGFSWSRLLARTRFDYRKEVGTGLDSSVVTAPVMWLQRALPEARLAVRQKRANGTVKDQVDHPMLALIQKPNPFYGDIALWGATILSWAIAGNAYWLIVRNRAGRPAELWYVPHWLIEPKSDDAGSEFITHYRYSPGGGETFRLDVEDVVHFRNGLDPRNLKLGISPIDGVIREIFADLESSNFVASLLRNMGVPGVIISPKSGAVVANDDVEATKSWFQQAFGGDRRGGALVMGAPTDVQAYGFNPQQMNLSEARDVAEERVCACLGIPPSVVGFGAGLQQTKVGATMEEQRKLAWHNGVLPLGRQLADELQRSLLPLFTGAAGSGRADQLETYWETEGVPALQEDENKQIERKLKEFTAGAITLWDYLTETGREADQSHKYYVRPIGVIEVPLAEAGKGREDAPDPGADSQLPAPDPQVTEPELEPAGAGAKARKGKPPKPGARAGLAEMKRGEAYALMLQRAETGHRAAFEKALLPIFRGWGERTSKAAKRALKSEAKAEGDDIVARILALLDIPAWREELTQAYAAQYLDVAKAVAGAAETAGLGTGLPDPVARAIVASGGKRVGLVDIDAQTKEAIFDALAEGRAEGEGADALAARIAHEVEGGVWNEAETRARIIARTETKFAQNLSTIETGRAAGVTRFMVFDGRLGPGRSDPEHIARNGSIVTADEAVAMAAAEHPNGTLSFAPHFSLED